MPLQSLEYVQLLMERLLQELNGGSMNNPHFINFVLRCIFRAICHSMKGIEEQRSFVAQCDPNQWPEGMLRQGTVLCQFEYMCEKLQLLKKRVEALHLWYLNMAGDARPNENIVKYRDWIKDKDMSNCMGPNSQYVALISKDDRTFMMAREMAYQPGYIRAAMSLEQHAKPDDKAKLQLSLP